MLSKSLNEKHLETYLTEVKEAMKSSCNSAETLDSKTNPNRGRCKILLATHNTSRKRQEVRKI